MTARDAIFISHANPEDNAFTLWLGAKLAAAGYEVWADVMRLRGGDDWQRKLENALRNKAAKVLLVGTSHGVDKRGVRNEIQIATDTGHAIKDDNFIIPLRLQPFSAPFLIVHAQYIDFTASWSAGLVELMETLQEQGIPKKALETPALWQSLQLIHARIPTAVPETLVSNWIKFSALPPEIKFYDFKTGIVIGHAQAAIRDCRLPVVPFKRGFLSFSDYPSLQDTFGPTLPITLIEAYPTADFLESGWEAQGIYRKDARNKISDLLRRGIENVLDARGLQPHVGSNQKSIWYSPRGVSPEGKVRFAWPDNITGLRQIMGFSKKRNLWWHYAFGPQVAMMPEPHVKMRSGLIFTENGKDPLDNAKKMHRMRRSFAKSWRNPRWRDMMLALLWWLSDGKDKLIIPFDEGVEAILVLPPTLFVSPVSIMGEVADAADEDDPNDNEDIVDDDALDEDDGLEEAVA